MAAKNRPKVPYPPSWQNRFFDAIERLPIPKLITFSLIFLAFSFVNHLAAWLEGKLPWGKVDGVQLTFQIWLLVALIAYDYFLSYSNVVIAQARPGIKISGTTYEELQYRFTHLSTRADRFIALIAAVIFVVSMPGPNFLPAYQLSGLSLVVVFITGIFASTFIIGFFWYLFRALRMIREIFNHSAVANIFHLEPVYAFAGFTSRVGIFFILFTTLTYLTNVVFSQRPNFQAFLAFTSIYVVLAIAAFIWPLGGLHAKLQKEKEAVSKENDERIKTAQTTLHRIIDKGGSAGLPEIHHGISALLELHREIKSISTWPWDASTLRGFVIALFVPLAVWLIQQTLLRFIVP